MQTPIHLLIRPSDEGGWEVRRFSGFDSRYPTLEEAIEYAECTILVGEGPFGTMQIQRWNGVTETRIFQHFEYRVNPRTDPVFRASMEFS